MRKKMSLIGPSHFSRAPEALRKTELENVPAEEEHIIDKTMFKCA